LLSISSYSGWRLALCPVVRAMRKQLQYSALNAELGEISYAAPQRMYDMHARYTA
jgi:hypothetical protein